jgi:hypothetical protein
LEFPRLPDADYPWFPAEHAKLRATATDPNATMTQEHDDE